MDFRCDASFLKVDEGLGLIFGFAIVCKVDGKPYFDTGELQPDGSRIRDHITEDAMLKSAATFMASSRAACVMHERTDTGEVVQDGGVVFCFPLTTDIAKAMGIETQKTGLLVAVKPDSPEALAKARAGKYRGFSIGGRRVAGSEEFVEVQE